MIFTEDFRVKLEREAGSTDLKVFHFLTSSRKESLRRYAFHFSSFDNYVRSGEEEKKKKIENIYIGLGI